MRRRAFIAGLGGAAMLPPRALRAQGMNRSYHLGFLLGAAREAPQNVAFLDELGLLGFIENQNLNIIAGSYGLRNEQYPVLAATFVRAGADAIICGGEVAARAALKATRNVPIFVVSDDVIAEELVQSLARPGGNVTGVSILSTELDGKRQDILIEAVPGARRMAALADRNITSPKHLVVLRDAAQVRGVELLTFSVGTPEEISPALTDAKASGAAAINVLATPLFSVNRRHIIERAANLRLPAIYQWPEMAEEGGLVAYGPRFPDIFRQLARQVAKVLRGVRPADIPIEQPTKFVQVINLKAAKAIELELPASLVLGADEIIE